MVPEDPHISIFDMNWRLAGLTPDNSPLSDFQPDTFSVIDSGYLFPGLKGSTTDGSDRRTSQALNLELGNINLTDHTDNGAVYPLTSSQLVGADGTACKDEPIEEQWNRLVNATVGFHPSYETARNHQLMGQDIPYPITTGVLPGPVTDQPLSGFSDQSTSSSPIFGSSSPKKAHVNIWASSRPYPYRATQPRKRSSSACAPHFVANRKRSSSDAYSGADNNSAGSTLLPNSFDVSSRYLNVPRQEGRNQQVNLLERQLHSRSLSSIDPMSLDNSYDSRPCHPAAWNENHGQGSHSPIEGMSSPGQMSMTGTSHFKQQVASEAVVQAARKKRKNPDGKVFGCDMCGAQLTTKQNLQYHISAHLGIRDFQCCKCNRPFTTPHVRTRHESRCQNSEQPDL